MEIKSDKIQWRLIPWSALEIVVRAFMFGNMKDGRKPDDWQLVKNKRDIFFDAAIRHIISWKRGEKQDQESGLSHLAHACCNILILLWTDINEK